MGVFDHGWVMVIEKTWTRDATMNHRHRWMQSMGAFARNSGLPSEPVGWPRHPKIQQDRKGHPTLLSICSSKACTALHGLRQALGFEGQSEYYALPNFLPTVFLQFHLHIPPRSRLPSHQKPLSTSCSTIHGFQTVDGIPSTEFPSEKSKCTLGLSIVNFNSPPPDELLKSGIKIKNGTIS